MEDGKVELRQSQDDILVDFLPTNTARENKQ
jgi:hypothetical protein